MTELRKKHERIAKSGTASEKRTAAAEKKLLVSYSKWKDTKYAWGGDSKKGIDCSALTRRIYREVYGHELPRVSTQQAQTGKKVSSKNLKAGDIVFFKPEGRTNHTAVYVGNSLFINASSSKGKVPIGKSILNTVSELTNTKILKRLLLTCHKIKILIFTCYTR